MPLRLNLTHSLCFQAPRPHVGGSVSLKQCLRLHVLEACSIERAGQGLVTRAYRTYFADMKETPDIRRIQSYAKALRTC